MIGIFGDSFAEDAKGGWAHRLHESYHVKNYGLAGSSTPTAYKKFLHALSDKPLKAVIFVYTAQYRIPILPQKYDGNQWLLKWAEEKHPDQQVARLASTYAMNFYDKDIHAVLCNAIFDSVNDICAERGIKLVNIVPFDWQGDREYERCYARGARYPTLTGLDRLSKRESGAADDYGIFLSASEMVCKRPNHLNEKNNEIVFDWCVNKIENNTTCLEDINEYADIDISEESWRRWFPNIPYERKL